jgi:hypothetical protein
MRQTILVVLAAIAIFASIAWTIVSFMPAPMSESDYLIAGSIAMLVALLVLFLGLASGRGNRHEMFFKKRLKQPKER